MHRTIQLLFALFLLSVSAWGQSAIIGTGTLNTNSQPDPLDRDKNFMHYQVVYTQTQLVAAGMPAGASILALGFSVTQSPGNLSNFEISLGHTLQATANPYISSGLTQVKAPFTYLPVVKTAGNFDMITFDTPFVWDGTSNIVVNTCSGFNTAGTPNGGLRRFTVMEASRYISQNTTSSCALATNTSRNEPPNIRFDYTTGGGCTGMPTPGNTLSTSTNVCPGVQFTLSLQNSTTGTGVSYQWESSADGINFTSVGSSGNNDTYTTSQSSAKYYRCQVTCAANTGTSAPVLVSMNSIWSCYCPSAASFLDYEDITRVQFGSSLNNTSACGSLTGTQGNATGSADLYSNFTSIAPTNIVQGTTHSITVRISQCDGGASAHQVRVYFDWNQNGVLTDAGEEYVLWAYASEQTHTITESIFVPVGAVTGNTLMRIVCKQSSTIGPCMVSSYGETEDYKVNVLPAPACLPPAFLTAAPGAYKADLAWTENGTASQWEIEWGSSPFTPTGVPNVTDIINTNYFLTGLSPETNYSYYVRSNCGGTFSTWTGPKTFTTSKVLTVNPTYLDFRYVPAGLTSSALSFTVSGIELSGYPDQIVVTAPDDFMVSLNSATGFGPSVSIPYTGPTLLSVPVYVKFSPAVANTAYAGNVNITGGGGTAIVSVSGTSDLFSSYCLSIPTGAGDEEILGVTVNGATNNSNCTTPAPGPGSILNRYSNFFTLAPLTSLEPNNTYSFSINEDECDGPPYYGNGCAIWIDFNQDGDFGDAGEQVFVESSTSSSPRTIDGNFTVPAGAVLGHTGMRIIVAESYWGANLTPCMSYEYGETEDYKVNIVAQQFPTITGNALVCQGSAGNIYYTEAGKTGYAWAISSGGTITGGGTSLDNNLTVTWTGSGAQTVSVNYNNSSGFPGPTPTIYNVQVNPLPGVAGTINGATTVAQGETGLLYNVTPIPDATGYNWVLPYGATIISGTNTNSITVNFAPDALSGTMTVTGINDCGSGPISPELNITVNPSVPVSLEIGTEIVNGVNCYNAIGTITVAGGNETFTVTGSGNATFIAGLNIIFLPGTTVLSGGFLHGYIAPDGPFCSNTKESSTNTDLTEFPIGKSTTNFSIYPNPTNGNITLIRKCEQAANDMTIKIYNMSGKLVYAENSICQKSHEIRLTDIPAGLYFVKVIAGDYVETTKLIKIK
jgi:hypothetical protein